MRKIAKASVSIFFFKINSILHMIFRSRDMTTLRQFTCDDLFRFNGINLDPLTEMYGLSFYLQVLTLT